jgi:hypothetical protein
MQELWVLSLNDFPVGIYTSSAKADEALRTLTGRAA